LSITSRRQSPYPSLPRDAININTNNPGVKNPEQNIGHASYVETSSLRPPLPYEATDGAQNNNNPSEINQSHIVYNQK